MVRDADHDWAERPEESQGERSARADVMLEVMCGRRIPGQEYTCQEIGDFIGLSEMAVYNIMAKGLKNCRAEWDVR